MTLQAVIKARKLVSAVISVALTLNYYVVYASAANNVVYKAANKDMKIALTFDDGPHPKWTAEILDILEEYNIKTTFFVIGKNAELYPDIVKREIDEGHEIGNHSYSHIFLNKRENETIENELSTVSSMISDSYNTEISIIRPPGGLFDKNLEKYALANNCSIVLWSVDTLDWKHSSPESIIENILSNTSSGDIILMHDFISGSSPTPEVLRSVIPVLIERGFEFVTVSELLKTTD